MRQYRVVRGATEGVYDREKTNTAADNNEEVTILIL